MTDTPTLHPNALRVQETLRACGSPTTVRMLDDAARTAAQAAAALGCDVGAIANSLVFVADGSPVLVLTSGAHRADPAKLAAVLGAQSVQRADPDTVRRATGFAIGGVPPVAHATTLPVVVDVTLRQYDVVWAAAGHPHAVFPTSYAELLRITAGQSAEVA